MKARVLVRGTYKDADYRAVWREEGQVIELPNDLWVYALAAQGLVERIPEDTPDAPADNAGDQDADPDTPDDTLDDGDEESTDDDGDEESTDDEDAPAATESQEALGDAPDEEVAASVTKSHDMKRKRKKT